ncbi:MAG TPA: RidA family protein [Spirochaetota bacterium]
MKLRIIPFVIALLSCTRDKEVIPSDGESEKSVCNSLAVRVGHTLYISGIVGGVGRDMKGQIETAYEILGLTLKRFKGSPSDVVSERIYTMDMDGFLSNGGIRSAFYGDHFPASTWIEVRRLVDTGLLVEIEAVTEIP